MRTDEVLQRFEIGAPLSVMARAAITRVLNSKRLDEMFARTRVKQKCGELLFSTVVDLMALVAMKAKPTVHAAYKHRHERMTVAINSIYNRLQGIEPPVSRSLVRETAQDLVAVIAAMKKGRHEPVLKGYRVRVVDANHLASTDHRIKELRSLSAAALPGTGMVIFDPDHLMAVDLIPWEDGHASELTLMPPVIESTSRGAVLVMDRGLGSKEVLLSIAAKGAYYIARHNKGLFQEWSPVGKQRKVSQTASETIYERRIQFHYQGEVHYCRRLTIKLAEKTRFGESEINLLTNLPARVKAPAVSKAYRKRWGVEKYFCHLDQVTNAEIQSLGYPQAALFSFAMGLFMLNILNTLRIAVAAAAVAEDQDEPLTADDISVYHSSIEIVDTWKGMNVAIDGKLFERKYSAMPLPKLAKELLRIAKGVQLRCVLKAERGPKRPPPRKTGGGRGQHVATARVLARSSV